MSKQISVKLERKIREQAKNRCGYCLSKQDYIWDTLQVDHILPRSKGGTNEENNLWLVCGTCNGAKSDKIEAPDEVTNVIFPLFNPRTQDWREHFEWSNDSAQIIGKTAVGRATVITLKLNRERFVKLRRKWTAAGWHPPKD